MDTRIIVARLEEEIAALRQQNKRVRACLAALAAIVVAPWLIAATSQAPAKPAANTTLTGDRLVLSGPNGSITLRGIDGVSTLGADNNRPAPGLGIFAGTGDTPIASLVAGPSGSELRIGDRGAVRLSATVPGRGRVEVVNEDGKTGAEMIAAPGGGGSVVVRGPGGAGVAVVETATDGSGQLEVRDAAGRIIQRIP
jgi:hypothetical protein